MALRSKFLHVLITQITTQRHKKINHNMELPWQKKQDIGIAVSRCLSGSLPTQRSPRQDQSSLAMGQRLGTTAMEYPSHLILIQNALSHSPVDFDGV